jgi:hypothetical protein
MKKEIIGVYRSYSYKPVGGPYSGAVMCDDAVRDLLGWLPPYIKVTLSDKRERGFIRADHVGGALVRLSKYRFGKMHSQPMYLYPDVGERLVYVRPAITDALRHIGSPKRFYWKVEAVNNK